MIDEKGSLACCRVQSKAIQEMKKSKGDNWKLQYTHVCLETAVGKQIIGMESHPGKKGKALAIDLKVMQDDEHVEAMAAKIAAISSPRHFRDFYPILLAVNKTPLVVNQIFMLTYSRRNLFLSSFIWSHCFLCNAKQNNHENLHLPSSLKHHKFSSILSRFETNSGSQFGLLRLVSSSSLTSTTSLSRSSTSQRLEQMMTPSSHESSHEASEHAGGASLSCRMLASWYDDDDSDDEVEIQETPAPPRSSR